eukprot:334015-Hanusia_phi.AAC.1
MCIRDSLWADHLNNIGCRHNLPALIPLLRRQHSHEERLLQLPRPRLPAQSVVANDLVVHGAEDVVEDQTQKLDVGGREVPLARACTSKQLLRVLVHHLSQPRVHFDLHPFIGPRRPVDLPASYSFSAVVETQNIADVEVVLDLENRRQRLELIEAHSVQSLGCLQALQHDDSLQDVMQHRAQLLPHRIQHVLHHRRLVPRPRDAHNEGSEQPHALVPVGQRQILDDHAQTQRERGFDDANLLGLLDELLEAVAPDAVLLLSSPDARRARALPVALEFRSLADQTRRHVSDRVALRGEPDSEALAAWPVAIALDLVSPAPAARFALHLVALRSVEVRERAARLLHGEIHVMDRKRQGHR